MLEEQLLVEKTRSQHIQTNAINTINQITYDGYNMITLRSSFLGFQSDLPMLSTNGETSTDLLPLPTTTSTITNTTASNVLPLSTPSLVKDNATKAEAPSVQSNQPTDQSNPSSDPILNQDLTTSADNTTDRGRTISTDHTTQHTTNTIHTHPVNSSYKGVIIDPDSQTLTNPPETNTVLDQLKALYEVQQRLITRLNDLERGHVGKNYDPQLSNSDAKDNRGSNIYREQQVVVYNDTNNNTNNNNNAVGNTDSKSTGTTAVKWGSTSASSGGYSSSIIKAVIYKNNNRDTYNNDDEMRYTFKDSSNNNDQSTSEGHNYDPFLTDDITVTKRSLTRRRSRYSIYIRICLDIFLICIV